MTNACESRREVWMVLSSSNKGVGLCLKVSLAKCLVLLIQLLLWLIVCYVIFQERLNFGRNIWSWFDCQRLIVIWLHV
jgi:hypothetical protein